VRPGGHPMAPAWVMGAPDLAGALRRALLNQLPATIEDGLATRRKAAWPVAVGAVAGLAEGDVERTATVTLPPDAGTPHGSGRAAEFRPHAGAGTAPPPPPPPPPLVAVFVAVDERAFNRKADTITVRPADDDALPPLLVVGGKASAERATKFCFFTHARQLSVHVHRTEARPARRGAIVRVVMVDARALREAAEDAAPTRNVRYLVAAFLLHTVLSSPLALDALGPQQLFTAKVRVGPTQVGRARAGPSRWGASVHVRGWRGAIEPQMNKRLNSFAVRPFNGFVHTGMANGLYTRFLVAAAAAAKASGADVVKQLGLTAKHLVSVSTRPWGQLRVIPMRAR